MTSIFNKLNQWISLILINAHIDKHSDGYEERRRIMRSTFSWNIILNLTTGTFMAQFYLSFNASANDINNIIIISSLAGFLQIISPFILERLRTRRTLLIVLRVIVHVSNLLLATLAPILIHNTSTAILIVGLCYTIMYVTNALLTPGIQAWQIANISQKAQLGFFSLQNIINTFLCGTILVFSAFAADMMAAHIGKFYALVIIRCFCLILAVVDILALFKLKEPIYKKMRSGMGIMYMAKSIGKNKKYFLIIAFVCLWNFTLGLPSQYFNTYLLKDLGASYTLLQLIQIINIAFVILLTPFWKKIIGRIGMYKTLAVCFLVVSVHGLLYSFVNQSNFTYMFPLAVSYWFIFAVGMVICLTMIPYQHLPERNRTMFLAMFSAFGALAALSGNLVGRFIYDALDGRNTNFFGREIVPAQVIYIVFGFSMIVSGLIALILSKKIKKIEDREMKMA